MVLHVVAFKADFFPLCIAEPLVLGTVTCTCMWAPGISSLFAVVLHLLALSLLRSAF